MDKIELKTNNPYFADASTFQCIHPDLTEITDFGLWCDYGISDLDNDLKDIVVP